MTSQRLPTHQEFKDFNTLHKVIERVSKQPLKTTLEMLWKSRACFVCSVKGACPHREIDVDLAMIEAVRFKRAQPAAHYQKRRQ